MAYEIKWTNAAKDNYHDIVSYLFDEWGGEIAEKFTEELQSRLKHLTLFPLIGRQHLALSSVRQLIISKHQILFYTIIDQTIVVLNVLDSKMSK